jgi:hypothetical protein
VEGCAALLEARGNLNRERVDMSVVVGVVSRQSLCGGIKMVVSRGECLRAQTLDGVSLTFTCGQACYLAT